MSKNGLKKWFSIGMAALLGLGTLAGCGSSSSSGGNTSSGTETPSPAAVSADGKGRYVETALTVPFEEDRTAGYTNILDLGMTDEGKLRMVVQSASYSEEDYQVSIPVYDSEDNGKTWTQTMDLADLDIMKSDDEHMNVDVQNAAVSPQGNIFFIVSQNVYSETEADGMVTSTGEEHIHYCIIDKDGKLSEMKLDAPELPADRNWEYTYDPNEEAEAYEEDETAAEDDIQIHEGGEDEQQGESYAYVSRVLYPDEENIFLITDEGIIFHVSAAEGKITDKEQDLSYIAACGFSGDQLVTLSWDGSAAYDVKTGKKTGEYPKLTEVMNDFRGSFVLGSSAENGKIYIAGNEGIFLYDLNTDEKTMLADGKLTSLVSSEVSVSSFEVLPNDEFIICLEDYTSNDNFKQLYHYAFDPDMPSRPDKELTVYVLNDFNSYMAEQMCAKFQKAHPDVYVNVEYGVSGDDAVTSADAIRTLNTQIMAGEGPDVIFLEGLPVDSYVEKGLLADISSTIEDKKQQGQLFENVADTYKTENGTFAVPTTFAVPVIVADKDLIGQIHTLDDLADAAERFAADENRGSQAYFMDTYSVFSLTATMMPTNAGSWFKEDGSLEPEALKSYLKSLRRFSDSVNSLVDEEDTYMSDMHELLMNEDIQQYLTYSNLSGSDVSWEAVNVASGGVQVALGNLAGTEGLQYIYSAQKKGSSIDFASMPGSIDNVFVPIGVVGVNAKSDDVETAKTFVDYLISEEGQKSMNMNSGFPINKAAFDKAMEDPNKGNPGYKEGDSVGSAGMTDGNGKELEIELYWPDQTFIDNFKTRLSEMDTPAYNDDMILTTIMKDCIYYVMGDGEVDTVVDQVVKDISIYLSE